MRLLLIAGVAMFAACAAGADQAKDGSVEVKAGRYQWKQETSVIGVINKKEENIECLIPQKAKMTLTTLVQGIDKTCTVDKVSPIANGYSFRLSCEHPAPIRADATVSSSPTSLAVHAKGSATVMGIIPASVSASANANYIGECTPEEFAKETERYAKENP